MTACIAFEDRLLGYDDLRNQDRVEVDRHMVGCSSCREYVALLRDIESALTKRTEAIRLDVETVKAVHRTIQTAAPVPALSSLPEWLDVVAACAMTCLACGLFWSTGLLSRLVISLSSVMRW